MAAESTAFTDPIPLPSGDSFGALLRRWRLRTGRSQNSLATVVGINASWVNRLESGEREGVSRQVALALARGMGLSITETDSLLFAAGHVPPSWQKLGARDSTMAAVLGLLTNDALSPESRADFRAIVECMAARWQGNGVPVVLPVPERKGKGR